MMPVFLPIAGISLSLPLLVAVGVVIGFLSGLLGVGGGFLLTPVLMMIGVRATVAAASDTNSIVATSASSLAAHWRMGNVDMRLGTVLLAGGLLGAGLGVEVVKRLRDLGQANFVINSTYVVMLGSVGGYMLIEGLLSLRRGTVVPKLERPGKVRGFLDKLPWQMDFPRSGVRHSVLVPASLCAVVGLLTAVMGVGGGFMIVPMMVYLLRVPMRVAVGTSLFQILFTCTGATLVQAGANHTVDLELALLVAAGSTLGAQLGARVSRLLRAEHLKVLLGGLALVVMGRIAAGMIMHPASLLSHVKVH
jgi:uncharacterized membrane protein YfcA